MEVAGIDIDQALGKLHRFWFWCRKYAEDGDLRGHGLDAPCRIIGLTPQNLVECRFVDTEPYLRVHDWWKYIGHFLRIKYKHTPKKWKRVRTLYKNLPSRNKERSKNGSKNPITQHNTTQHNITKPTNSGVPPQPMESQFTPQTATALLVRPGIAETIAFLAQAKALHGSIEVTPDYRKPDTALQKLLLVVKQLQGFGLDDRVWDSVYFKRYARAAKDLLHFFDDDWKRAGTCAKEITVWLDELGKAWTVETIVKHAPAWKKGGDWKKTHGY